MPRTHLLDTSVYSQPIKRSAHPVVESRWRTLGDDSLAISAICEAEVLFGIEKHGSTRLQNAYDSTLRGRLPLLQIDADVAATYARLRAECERSGQRVADMDLLIAATAKTHGLIVATLNVSDFNRIPGITFEDWSVPATPPSTP